MQYSVSPRLNDSSFGPKPERERQDADADAPRHQEMPELVHENQHAEHEQERENTGHTLISPYRANPTAIFDCAQIARVAKRELPRPAIDRPHIVQAGHRAGAVAVRTRPSTAR